MVALCVCVGVEREKGKKAAWDLGRKRKREGGERRGRDYVSIIFVCVYVSHVCVCVSVSVYVCVSVQTFLQN